MPACCRAPRTHTTHVTAAPLTAFLWVLPFRDEWLSSLVDDLDESDSYEYLKHLTDVYRLHMFDVIMQYRSIFFDTPAAGAGSGAASTASSQADLGKLPGAGASGAFGSGAGPAVRETNVLYSWVQYRVQHYVRALHRHLPQISEGGNLASVLEHCMYCGTSLARVGLDVSALLHPLFEQCSLRWGSRVKNCACRGVLEACCWYF